LRESGLEFRIASNQGVIVRIRNLGRVFLVVEPVVPRDLGGELFQLFRSFGFGHAVS
jgi:hypothetical protein